MTPPSGETDGPEKYSGEQDVALNILRVPRMAAGRFYEIADERENRQIARAKPVRPIRFSKTPTEIPFRV